MTKAVVVGDVGGTNVRFGVASAGADGIKIDHFVKMPGDQFDGFEAAFQQFLSDTSEAFARLPAVFALAGPPVNGVVTLTNRDWTVSSEALIAKFGCASVDLHNDFAAMARSVPEVKDHHFELIRPGTSRDGAPIIVAGPGTGFGVATLVPTKDGMWTIVNGEGGHMAYAPVTPTEIELTRLLRESCGYVSNELVCSGIGLEPVHKALCVIFDRAYEETTPADMIESAAAGDEMFEQLRRIRACGTMSAVGDLVYANGGLGGVVLAGGVSERLAPYFKSPDAMERFTQRGLNSKYLADCPIKLLHDPVAPLIGAAALSLKDS